MSADRREIDVPLGRTIAFYIIMIVGAAGLFLIVRSAGENLAAPQPAAGGQGFGSGGH